MNRSTIGLSNACYCKRVDSGSGITYDDGALLPGAVQAEIAITRDDVNKYADNVLIYNESSFRSGTITLTEAAWDDQTFAYLTGNTYTTQGTSPNQTHTVQSVANPTPPYVAFGMIQDTITEASGTWSKSYTAVFLPKVKFAEQGGSAQTKGESTSFTDPVLVGTIYADESGMWKEIENFSTLSAAQSWLFTKMDVPTT